MLSRSTCPVSEVYGAVGVDGTSEDSVGVMGEFGHAVKQHSSRQHSSGITRMDEVQSGSVKMLKDDMNRLSWLARFRWKRTGHTSALIVSSSKERWMEDPV